MFNFSGSEMVFLLLLALIILGPDKLPDAIKKFGKTYAEFKKVSSGFQTELRSALDEPLREMRSTADILKSATNFDSISDSMKPVSDTMAAATPAVQPAAAETPAASSPESPAENSSESAAAAPAETPDAAPAPTQERPPGPAFHSAAPPLREEPVPEQGQEEPTA